jgi:hypothetical protein
VNACRWLEAAGIRVVPMVWDSPVHEKLDMLSQVNGVQLLQECCKGVISLLIASVSIGVLLPGGDLDHFSKVLDAYFVEAKFLYKYALQQNEKGDEFFMWGTCQGFQMLCACAADSLSVVEPGFQDTACVMMPLNFTKEAETSRMFGTTVTPAHILEALKSYPSTLNVHRFGVTPATFRTNANISTELVMLSTNVDGKGREFVSTMEHRSANIFGVQWHPEWCGRSDSCVCSVQSVRHVACVGLGACYVASCVVLVDSRVAYPALAGHRTISPTLGSQRRNSPSRRRFM